MKYITLSKGARCKVDDDDYEKYKSYKWYTSYYGYAVRTECAGGVYKKIFLHREIANTPDGFHTDHANGDRLDNRKRNLRVCTPAENSFNRKRQVNNKSGVKGVHWCKFGRNWRARITVNGIHTNIGRFDTAEEAGKAYKDKAIELHKEFARFS